MFSTRSCTPIAALFAAALAVLSATPAIAQDLKSKTAAELMEILKSDGPKADKALACKFLAVRGSSDAVPLLAPLLADEQLNSWARIPLEAIPGKEADEALRAAAETLQGRLLVGVINSLGVRRDAGAVLLLTKHLDSQDVEVATAAAAALGRIGSEAAAAPLRKSLAAGKPIPIRTGVAYGCVMCAERLDKDGKSELAMELYDEVRKADVPFPRIIEATRGAILARKEAGLPLLLEQLRSPHKGLFQLGLSTAREFPGKEVDKALAAEVDTAPPERAAVIVTAMADRTDTVDLSAVMKAAEKGPLPVRLAATSALGRIGNGSCLTTLLNVATEGNAELTDAARGALAALDGESIDKEIAAQLPKAQGKTQLLLIELTGLRQIEATADLVKALDSSDKTVRTAALTSLGATVPQKSLSVLINQVVSPKKAEDAAAAQTALKTAAIRMPDREVCAAEISAAYEKAPAATKVTLLQILAEVGGTKALATVAGAARSNNDLLQDESSKLLGKWMTADVAPVLLDLSKTAPGEKYQVRAMRGYLRVARQFVMPEAERLVMCQKAFDAAQQTAEKRLVLDILKQYSSVETLKMAINVAKVPELKDEATQAALFIAQKSGSKSEEVKSLLAKLSLAKVKVEIVKAQYGAGANQKDVTKVIQDRASDLQLIALASDSYNEAFGGDPAPSTVKQLKIQYRINGKVGEATFAENALIVLPMPK